MQGTKFTLRKMSLGQQDGRTYYVTMFMTRGLVRPTNKGYTIAGNKIKFITDPHLKTQGDLDVS